MMSMSSLTVMGVDLSYRHTGICILRKDEEMVRMQLCLPYQSPPMGNGFESLILCSKNLNKILKYLECHIKEFSPDIVIVEMPCFSQSAKSAIAIGMLWGLIGHLPQALLIEPSALKVWSNSKKGDGKEKVKEKVLSRLHLEKKQSANDNTVDAIGIALLFLDTINEIKYETAKQQSDFRAFVLEN